MFGRIPRDGSTRLMYGSWKIKLPHMEKMQIYRPREELEALRQVAARSGSSVAAVVRDAIRKVVLKPTKSAKRGPVAIWDGVPKRPSMEHDSIYDEVAAAAVKVSLL